MDWQPIETVPENTFVILLAGPALAIPDKAKPFMWGHYRADWDHATCRWFYSTTFMWLCAYSFVDLIDVTKPPIETRRGPPPDWFTHWLPIISKERGPEQDRVGGQSQLGEIEAHHQSAQNPRLTRVPPA